MPNRGGQPRTTARDKILEAARTLFTTHGYASTTIERIAREAGVAVQTVYFTFHNKPSVLKELLDLQVAGDTQPLRTLDRPWAQEVVAEPDPYRHLRLQVRGAASIHARVAPLLDVLRQAAAHDEAVAELWRTNQRQRREVQEHLLRSLRRKRPFVRGMTLRRATDLCYALLGPEMYLLLVRENGWSSSEWERWTTRALTRDLLGDPKE